MNQEGNQLITFNSHVTFDDLERKILGLARDGYQNKEMIKVLGFSRGTLKRHWWVIRAKLSTRTIAETVAVAIGKHIIGPYQERNHPESVMDPRALR